MTDSLLGDNSNNNKAVANESTAAPATATSSTEKAAAAAAVTVDDGFPEDELPTNAPNDNDDDDDDITPEGTSTDDDDEQQPGAKSTSSSSSSHRPFSKRVSDDLRDISENIVQGVAATPHAMQRGGRLTLLCCGRCIRNIPKKWPRSYTFVLGVVLPLWLLIAVSMVLGLYLARLERPQEIIDNDAILADRALFLADRAIATYEDEESVLTNATGDEVLQNLEMFTNTSAFENLSFNWIRYVRVFPW